jgi:hypothetical protein
VGGTRTPDEEERWRLEKRRSDGFGGGGEFVRLRFWILGTDFGAPYENPYADFNYNSDLTLNKQTKERSVIQPRRRYYFLTSLV